MSADDLRHIPFNRPYATGRELGAISEAVANAHLAADGEFSRRCRAWLERELGSERVLVVHSCTAALELSALLLGIEPGDEVIMPSYTYVTTATAFAMRGATPVFVDIRPDTLNIDERLIEGAITDRTRAVVPVHYAGVACEMEAIEDIARRHSLSVVEDAAQGICASYHDRPLGTFGRLAALSFHETKNVTCGHGGALVVNDPALAERAEVLRDKGTNRSSFIRGQVDKYTWMDLGSSYAISDLAAAFLWPQLLESAAITERRRAIWDQYHEAFAAAEAAGFVRRPCVPDGCAHNAHLYYLLLPDEAARNEMLESLDGEGVNAVFHYIPLHSSPGGRRYGRPHGSMEVTDEMSGRLLRMPFWTEMTPAHVERAAEAVIDLLPRVVGRRGTTQSGIAGR